MRAFVVLLMVVLAGCAAPVSESSVAKMTTPALCDTFGKAIRQGAPEEQIRLLRGELATRTYYFDDSDLDRVKNERMRVGMTDCGMYASWGLPTSANRTTTGAGTRVQYVYGLSGKRNYVYTEGGIVRAIQN